MMVLADELHEELSSREDDSSGSGWKQAPCSSKGVKLITTGSSLLTNLIVSLSLSGSVDSVDLAIKFFVHVHQGKTALD